MDDLKRAARRRAEADRALRPTKRTTGVITAIIDSTHVMVNIGTRQVRATVPASILGVAVSSAVILREANESVVEAVTKLGDGRVNGASGSWSWWYQDLGIRVELYIAYAGSIDAGSALDLAAATLALPATLLPPEGWPFAASCSNNNPVSARLAISGLFGFRNNSGSSQTSFYAYGNWPKA